MEGIEEFVFVSQWFINYANNIEEGWSIENAEDFDNYFIKRRSFSILNIGNRKQNYSEGDEFYEADDIYEAGTSTDFVCQTEHHILFNQSYGVPVIYFSIAEPSGKRVSLAEIWQHLKSTFAFSKDANMWSLLTEEVHPILQRPFYVFHPCHTSELVKQVKEATSPRSFFLIWLSFLSFLTVASPPPSPI